MPKVLRIINRFNLGGPTFNACYLTKYLSPEFETLLIGGEKEEAEESSIFIAENLGLKPLIISELKRAIHPINDWKAYWKIRKLIREFKPDIVHTHAAKAGLIGRLAAKHEGVKVIVHTFHGHVFHSYFSGWQTELFKKLERYCASFSSKIITLSPAQLQELSEIHKIAPKEKFEIINLGFDLSRFSLNQNEKRESFRKHFLLAENEIAIGIIGRLTSIKNHIFFLEAFAMLKQKTDKKIKAFIIGDGEDKKIILEKCATLQLKTCEINNLNPNTDIVLTSWIKDIDWANAGLDIVALTSLNEGTPVSLIEAQAAGKPIVSTRVGGIEDIVIENDNAFLIDNFDKTAFCDKLLFFVENDAERTKRGEKGKENVTVKFSYSRLVKDVTQLYNNLINQNK